MLYVLWLVLVLRRMHQAMGKDKVHCEYAVLLGIGVVMPWMALDILFFDEAFLLTAYAAMGSMMPERHADSDGFMENAEHGEEDSKCTFLSPGEPDTSAPTQSSN